MKLSKYPKIHCYNYKEVGRVYCRRFKSAVFAEIHFVFDRLQSRFQCKQCLKARQKVAKAQGRE